MAAPVTAWTEPLPTARLRADPSGVQDASTQWQATLLPGMTTQTTNIRYISLFTAARYLRQTAGEESSKNTSWNDYWRRLEALIAISSVLHHAGRSDVPSGIVGRTHADQAVSGTTIRLQSGIHNPPYRIYRGTLGALDLFDVSQPSEPLFESGTTPLKLAKAAWLGKRVGSPTTDRKTGAVCGPTPGIVLRLSEGWSSWYSSVSRWVMD